MADWSTTLDSLDGLSEEEKGKARFILSTQPEKHARLIVSGPPGVAAATIKTMLCRDEEARAVAAAVTARVANNSGGEPIDPTTAYLRACLSPPFPGTTLLGRDVEVLRRCLRCPIRPGLPLPLEAARRLQASHPWLRDTLAPCDTQAAGAHMVASGQAHEGGLAYDGPQHGRPYRGDSGAASARLLVLGERRLAAERGGEGHRRRAEGRRGGAAGQDVPGVGRRHCPAATGRRRRRAEPLHAGLCRCRLQAAVHCLGTGAGNDRGWQRAGGAHQPGAGHAPVRRPADRSDCRLQHLALAGFVRKVIPNFKDSHEEYTTFQVLHDLYGAISKPLHRSAVVQAVDGTPRMQADGSYLVHLTPPGVPCVEPPGSEDELRGVVACVLRGLAALHAEGFVHRDVRWRNIIYLPAEGRWLLIDLEHAGRVDCDCRRPPFPLQHWSDRILEGDGTYSPASDLRMVAEQLMASQEDGDGRAGALLVRRPPFTLSAAGQDLRRQLLQADSSSREQLAAALLAHPWLQSPAGAGAAGGAGGSAGSPS